MKFDWKKKKKKSWQALKITNWAEDKGDGLDLQIIFSLIIVFTNQ